MTKVTSDAVLGPIRMILAASVCEAFRTGCPLTEYKYSPTWQVGKEVYTYIGQLVIIGE